ncbi:MAG: NTP transferase domain-containing protein [Candidatus Magasanikbacteria bacterium]|nr:NTP transferase domain-containing protein [Candidatus Magasanikbacteria bacterium]
MNAIILCGGLSTRLGEITKTIPKVLLEIKGKTVLDWQLEKLKAIGISEVVLAAGHLAEVLHKSVGLHRNGVDLIFAIEQEKLGTGGAIKHAWSYVSKAEEPVVILNGDVLTKIDLADMIKCLSPYSDGIILGAKVEDAASYGTLEYDNKCHLKKFKEKEGLQQPGFINGGIYIFNPQAKKYFPETRSFSIEYDVFPHMKDLYVYESDKTWVDIGVPERLDWARSSWQG